MVIAQFVVVQAASCCDVDVVRETVDGKGWFLPTRFSTVEVVCFCVEVCDGSKFCSFTRLPISAMTFVGNE